MNMQNAREQAAQCWCDPRISNLEMDTRLAEVFAEKLHQISTPSMENYDLNEANNMDKVHVIELTFQQWDYKITRMVKVGGNCSGMTNIATAVGVAYDELPTIELCGVDLVQITLTKNDGSSTLLCEDEDNRGEDWLMDMLVKAEIVSLGEK